MELIEEDVWANLLSGVQVGEKSKWITWKEKWRPWKCWETSSSLKRRDEDRPGGSDTSSSISTQIFAFCPLSVKILACLSLWRSIWRPDVKAGFPLSAETLSIAVDFVRIVFLVDCSKLFFHRNKICIYVLCSTTTWGFVLSFARNWTGRQIIRVSGSIDMSESKEGRGGSKSSKFTVCSTKTLFSATSLWGLQHSS